MEMNKRFILLHSVRLGRNQFMPTVLFFGLANRVRYVSSQINLISRTTLLSALASMTPAAWRRLGDANVSPMIGPNVR
jgi:hypothetical protein